MGPILTKKIVKALKIVAYILLFIALVVSYAVIAVKLSAFWLVFPWGEVKCSSDPAAIVFKLAFFETPLVIATSLALFLWAYMKSRLKMYLYLHLPITLLIGVVYITARMVYFGLGSV